MKSLPLPVAVVRRDLADVIESARRGQRVRVTRHGKPVAWIIGEEEHSRLHADGKEPRNEIKSKP
jgi:prevent-host-death family protein